MEVLEPIEKPAKKTYKKHKTGKTLGVAPYLNKKLKERTIGEKTFYPVYWQITFNGMNTQIKSESFPNFGVTEFDFSNDIVVVKKIEREKQKIESCIPKIIEYFEQQHNRIPKIGEIINDYNDIYKSSLGELVNGFLCLYLSFGLSHSDMYDACMKEGKQYPKKLDDMLSSDLNFDSFGTLGELAGSAEVNLNIISKKYSKVYNFLRDKFPSQIWRLNEIIKLLEDLPKNDSGFNDSIFEFNSKITWYDFETGRLKRFLYNLGVVPGFLSVDELECILNDLATIKYFNFSEHSNDYYFQDEMNIQFINHLNNFG